MASGAPTPPLRRLLDDHVADLYREVRSIFEVEAGARIAEACARAKHEAAAELNQAIRRMKLADDSDELAATLLDAAGSFAAGAALFFVDAGTLRGARVRGVSEEAAAAFRELSIPLTEAPALAGAVETRDPVITAATPAEVSAQLSSLIGHSPDERAFVFPIAPGERVAGLLYAWGPADAAAIELLAQVAAALWAGIRPRASSELLSIAPAGETISAWERLSPEEQALHLRAQRFARVQVAEMRLRHPVEVQTGRAHKNLFGALRRPIETAREAFRERFFTPCPSMVDYLHLEMVRTLANDDPELLGKEYPGILA